MTDYVHLCDSKVGHPWNVAEILEDVVVFRFHSATDAVSSNSGVAVKWLHAIKEEEFLSMSNKDIEGFKKLYGNNISMLTIKYGEVVGINGWDVTFLPSDVISISAY